MGLDFWSTIRGVRLADTLIRELPRINAKGRQKAITLSSEKDDAELMSMLDKGFRFTGSFINAKRQSVVIVEK